MSYNLPNQTPRAKKGGGGIFFMIILLVGGYLLFSNLGTPKPKDGNILDQGAQGSAHVESEYDRQAAAEERRLDRETDDILGNTAAGKKMPTTGRTGAASGWDMDDVNTKKNPSTQKSATRSTKSNGDWDMEDVDTKKKKANSQFQFSNEGKTPAKAKSNDWEIEDVKGKKKTENGDWAIEEAGTKKDN